ncbi:nucleotide-binding universal stress UspA family protein [Kribbella amoyensis]|uniref:Nucleotide-binding universal stress UspA family protein n=1 Tax=Kribbella amoyensis TaxID=996641 RepID=A0A561C0Y3_9ACTN|nr:universal stress protein [Kribbella amoyensis]TWD84750.1 nucleotide-binding universal stress UspA family protein [Kribbella amoyensis]
MSDDVPALIIVGVDAAWRRTHALDWAVAEALARQRPLRAIHLVDKAKHHHDAYGPVQFDGVAVVPVKVDEAAGRLVDQVRAYLAETATELDLDVDLRVGEPAERLIDESGSALMVVVGRRGHGVFKDLLIGSTSDAVANRGRGPVVVVPNGWDQQVHREGPVLVGVDWIEAGQSDAAIEFAADHAAAYGVPLILVLAWDVPWVIDADSPVTAEDIDTWHGMADARGRELADEWMKRRRPGRRPGLVVRHHLVQGHPVAGLVDTSEALDAQLLTVGGRLRSRTSQFLLGSTARGVLHHAVRPVAVVHERE